MAIIRDPRQCWLALPEPTLRFAAPAPEPLSDPLPEFRTRAYWSAPLHVQRARDLADDAEVARLSELLIATALAGGGRLDA